MTSDLYREKIEDLKRAMQQQKHRDETGDGSLYGETDPKLIRAARAIAAKRNARRVELGQDDVGVLPTDLHDARAVFEALGMLRAM